MMLMDRAARTLTAAMGDLPWDRLDAEARDRAKECVRAILRELRDPDTAMAEAGAEIIRNVGPAETSEAHMNDAQNVWRFMIDQLLDQD